MVKIEHRRKRGRRKKEILETKMEKKQNNVNIKYRRNKEISEKEREEEKRGRKD